MVGEIRDADTASIAVNTALTGHLLLSTLHTNDASTTLPRLLDMGIEPFLLASTVNVAIGQRLVRKICSACKKLRQITSSEKQSLPQTLTKAYRGAGCDACNGTGYDGRIGINEILLIDNAVREAILRKASASEIRDIALRSGMITMIEDGFQKVGLGLTTIEEVLRVIHE